MHGHACIKLLKRLIRFNLHNYIEPFSHNILTLNCMPAYSTWYDKIDLIIMDIYIQHKNSPRTLITRSHPSQPTVVSLERIWWSLPSWPLKKALILQVRDTIQCIKMFVLAENNILWLLFYLALTQNHKLKSLDRAPRRMPCLAWRQ